MVTLPTSPLPTWATSPLAEIVNPGAKKISLGWETAKSPSGKLLNYGEAPPYQWFNYVMNNYGNWFSYLKETLEQLQSDAPSSTSAYIKSAEFELPATFEYDFRQSGASNLYRVPNLDDLKYGKLTYYGGSEQGLNYTSSTGAIVINKKGLLSLRIETESEAYSGAPRVIQSKRYYITFAGTDTLMTNGYTSNIYTGFTVRGSTLLGGQSPTEIMDSVCLEASLSPYPLTNMVGENRMLDIMSDRYLKHNFYLFVEPGDEIFISPAIAIQNVTNNKLKITADALSGSPNNWPMRRLVIANLLYS